MRTVRIRLAAAAAALCCVAGGVSVVAPSATASTVYLSPVYGNRVLIVELTHSETVLAAQLGAGHVINGVLGNDRWGPILDNDSAYRGANPPRPFRARAWNTVTGQQVIAEAASHPGGRVVFGVFTDNPDVPLWVMQDW